MQRKSQSQIRSQMELFDMLPRPARDFINNSAWPIDIPSAWQSIRLAGFRTWLSTLLAAISRVAPGKTLEAYGPDHPQAN